MSRRTYLIVVAVLTAIVLIVANGGDVMARGRAQKPAAKDFGPGPRTSSAGLYVATLQGATDLEPRKMYTLQALVIDGKTGEPVTNATIDVEGGMPQHGHGFPTRPRVTKNLDQGWYEVRGVRFNMGGWWELKLVITGPAGTDTVTFNLAL